MFIKPGERILKAKLLFKGNVKLAVEEYLRSSVKIYSSRLSVSFKKEHEVCTGFVYDDPHGTTTVCWEKKVPDPYISDGIMTLRDFELCFYNEVKVLGKKLADILKVDTKIEMFWQYNPEHNGVRITFMN